MSKIYMNVRTKGITGFLYETKRTGQAHYHVASDGTLYTFYVHSRNVLVQMNGQTENQDLPPGDSWSFADGTMITVHQSEVPPNTTSALEEDDLTSHRSVAT